MAVLQRWASLNLDVSSRQWREITRNSAPLCERAHSWRSFTSATSIAGHLSPYSLLITPTPWCSETSCHCGQKSDYVCEKRSETAPCVCIDSGRVSFSPDSKWPFGSLDSACCRKKEAPQSCLCLSHKGTYLVIVVADCFVLVLH